MANCVLYATFKRNHIPSYARWFSVSLVLTVLQLQLNEIFGGQLMIDQYD